VCLLAGAMQPFAVGTKDTTADADLQIQTRCALDAAARGKGRTLSAADAKNGFAGLFRPGARFR